MITLFPFCRSFPLLQPGVDLGPSSGRLLGKHIFFYSSLDACINLRQKSALYPQEEEP